MVGCKSCAHCHQYSKLNPKASKDGLCDTCNCPKDKHDETGSAISESRKRARTQVYSPDHKAEGASPRAAAKVSISGFFAPAPDVSEDNDDEDHNDDDDDDDNDDDYASVAADADADGEGASAAAPDSQGAGKVDRNQDGARSPVRKRPNNKVASRSPVAAAAVEARTTAPTATPTKSTEFAEDVVLITGAGQGIGRALALEFASLRPRHLVLVSRSSGPLVETVKLVKQKAKHVRVAGRQVDLAVPEACDALAKAIVEFGVTVLINNAGISMANPVIGGGADPEVSPPDLGADFDATLAVNTRAPLVLSQAVGLSLRNRLLAGESPVPASIVNISSQASRVALANHTAYCASKAALDSLTRSLALELAPFNCRVNSVLPTVCLTPMGLANWSDRKKAQPMLSRIPMCQFLKEDDIVQPVVFLASHQRARMVNGVSLPIDGGFLASPFSIGRRAAAAAWSAAAE